MSGFAQMKIASKLWAFIGLVLLSLVTIAGVGLARSASILSDGRAKLQVSSDIVRVTNRWNGLTELNASRNHAILVSSDPKIADGFKDMITQTSAEISELQKQLEALQLTDAERAQLQKIGELRKAMMAARDVAKAAKADGKADEAAQVFGGTYLPAMQAYIGAQRELVKLAEQEVVLVQADTESRRAGNSAGILIGLVVVMVIIFVGTIWLVRSIREPLDRANMLAARIAEGDLSSHITTQRHDEFGQLLRSLATMNESLARMVSQVRNSTDSIATASAEIASGNNDLAQRTEQTSSNLQSTASSMDSLTTTVQHSADNARQAASLAGSASSVAQRGGSVVREVVATMQEIDASSKKIADIISVIDGIAFQTNILALNAAVEAARAGEQGRGFAVVASEVRSLAQRSAEAAREIKTLITTSVSKVESGTRLVSDAGNTMDDIVQSVRRVADVINEITAAASEQSGGIAGVNEAISTLDQMTQQNAALVEQSAAAAESLRDQADQMKQAVAVFKVG